MNTSLLPGYPDIPGSPDSPFLPSIPPKPGVPLSPGCPINPFWPVKEVWNISYQPQKSLKLSSGADQHQSRSNKSCMSYRAVTIPNSVVQLIVSEIIVIDNIIVSFNQIYIFWFFHIVMWRDNVITQVHSPWSKRGLFIIIKHFFLTVYRVKWKILLIEIIIKKIKSD